MDETKIAELIARGRVTGAVTYRDFLAAFPDTATPDQLADMQERLESHDITLVDEEEDCDPPPLIETKPLSGRATAPSANEVPQWPVFYRDRAFEERLRRLGVPVEKCLCAFVIPVQIATARLLLPGDQALRAWVRLRELADELGFRAFINSNKAYRHHWDEAEDVGADPIFGDADAYFAEVQKRIAEADAVPPMPWHFRNAKHKQEQPPAPEFTDEELPFSVPGMSALFSPKGPYRCVRYSYGPPDCPVVPYAEIVLVPASEPWQVFAYRRFGGWNFCPWPDEQLSMLREWHRRYGAEVVSKGCDWYELFVPNPPRTRSDAERLCRETWYFGEEYPFDPPQRGDGDWVEAARTAHYWTFWWD